MKNPRWANQAGIVMSKQPITKKQETMTLLFLLYGMCQGKIQKLFTNKSNKSK
jgi:hypothetical protein